MCSPSGLFAQTWFVCLTSFLICSLTEVVARTVVVAFLGTCHDVHVVCTKLMLVLCVSVSSDAVLFVVSLAVPSIVVVAVRIWRDNVCLLRLRILSTVACVDVQVFEAMNLVVNLEIAGEVVGISLALLVLKKSQGVLWSVRVAGVLPLWVREARSLSRLVVSVEELRCLVV